MNKSGNIIKSIMVWLGFVGEDVMYNNGNMEYVSALNGRFLKSVKSIMVDIVERDRQNGWNIER